MLDIFQPDRDMMTGDFSNTKLDDLPLTIAYVPFQPFSERYDPRTALKRGTLFKDIDKPFEGKFTGGSM